MAMGRRADTCPTWVDGPWAGNILVMVGYVGFVPDFRGGGVSWAYLNVVSQHFKVLPSSAHLKLVNVSTLRILSIIVPF